MRSLLCPSPLVYPLPIVLPAGAAARAWGAPQHMLAMGLTRSLRVSLVCFSLRSACQLWCLQPVPARDGTLVAFSVPADCPLVCPIPVDAGLDLDAHGQPFTMGHAVLGPVLRRYRQLSMRLHMWLSQAAPAGNKTVSWWQVLWMGRVRAPREAALTLQRHRLGMQGTAYTVAQCLQRDDLAATPQAPKQSFQGCQCC